MACLLGHSVLAVAFPPYRNQIYKQIIGKNHNTALPVTEPTLIF